MTRALPKTLAIAALTIACSASPDINIGTEPDGSVAGSSGAAGSSGFGGVGGFGGGDNSLAALITEPPSEMAIEVITISCAGECKQVLAVARGGNDPYTFAWNDGVTTAAREICADDDTTFTVTVTDTAFVDDEFNYEAQTVTASVIADVIECPDAGVDAGADASAVPDAGVTDECSTDLETDPTCDVLTRGTDCPGTVMYDLQHPVEAGDTMCLTMYSTPALSLLAEMKFGVGCQLTNIAATSPLSFNSAWSWLVCWPAEARVERVGISGLDPSAILSFRHCPNCGK